MRKKEGEVVLVIEEVLFSIRVVKAFAREVRRLEKESLEMEIGLRAAGDLKTKLARLQTSLSRWAHVWLLWFGTRLVLSGSLSPVRWWSLFCIWARCTNPCRNSRK